MTSNLSKHLQPPAYINLGIEFGVRDSVGNMKQDIKDAFLLSKILYLEDLIDGTLYSPNKSHTPYKLIADSALKSVLYNEGKASCVVSFQRRTEGNFAVARLWEQTRTKKQKEGEQE